MLDRSLAPIAERDGNRLSTLLMDVGVNPEDAVVRSLADARIITVRPRKILGLMPERHPVADRLPDADAIGRTITQMTAAIRGSLAVAANGGDETDTA